MLQTLTIENFRCLQSVQVPLQPLTVLIGPNDSEKSAFLHAVQTLANERDGFTPNDYWRLSSSANITIHGSVVDDKGHEVGHVKKFAKFGKNPTIDYSGDARSLFIPCRLYQLPSSGIQMECPGFSEGDSLDLEPDGSKLYAMLDHFLRRDRAVYSRSSRPCATWFQDLKTLRSKPLRRQVVEWTS